MRKAHEDTWIAVKRYTADARRVAGKPKRYQRKFRAEPPARAAVARWQADPMVKAVWLWGPEEKRANGRSGPRPLLIQPSD